MAGTHGAPRSGATARRDGRDGRDGEAALDALLSDELLTTMGLLAEVGSGLTAKVEAQLAPWSLTSTELGVLLRVGRSADHRLRMTDLATQVGLSNSGLTRLVDRLVRAGHLCREHCPSDRRGLYAVLTPHGHRLLGEVVPGHLALLEQWLRSPLAPEAFGELTAQLRMLRDHIAPGATAGSPAVG